MTTLKKLTGFLAASLFLIVGLQAQTKSEAIDAYNQGVGLMATDVQGAINLFEKSILISGQVGDSAIDIRDKAIAVVPGLYYKLTYDNYTAKKYPEAIAAGKASLATMDKYKDDKNKVNVQNIIAQSYLIQGANYYKAGENEKAISSFDSSLMINPDNAKVLLSKSAVYAKMDDADNFSKTIDQTIEKGGSDATLVAQAKKQGMVYFKNLGSKSNAGKKYDAALNYLNQSLKYGEDKDVYYQLADAYNNKKNFDAALENAQKGLNLETGTTPDAKAKYYYQVAVANVGQGKKDEACANFKSASYGQFAVPSKAQMTNLKCAGAAPAGATK
jgi:tetratricopeptide (TPR) repeat protein